MTRLASGLPVGGDLEYADEVTLGRAFEGRRADLMTAAMQRFGTRGWLLFAAMAVLWGMPYLFIKQAVDSYSPASVVAGRTLLGALLLLPFALRQRRCDPPSPRSAGCSRSARSRWPGRSCCSGTPSRRCRRG